MKTKLYSKCTMVTVVILLMTLNLSGQGPTITGPMDDGLPVKLGSGITEGQVYSTEPGMTNYKWSVSSAGSITAGAGSESITVKWVNPNGQQTVSVTYDENTSGSPGVLIINYYPFPEAIDPEVIPQFVDPLPHFAAGLRVNAKAGGSMVIKAMPTKQIALSKGTKLINGVIDPVNSPTIGLGNYAGYSISYNGGAFGPAMWPAQTIEAQQGFPLQVKYENALIGNTYADFNILADQTLMMNGYQLTGDPLIQPYMGDIPMVVHLHGGEMPSGSDGGPNAWFTPGYKLTGPAFKYNSSSLSTYPNMQEATTLWFHPHDDGLTRINVYTGLAGYYFLRGGNEEAAHLPGWTGDDKVLQQTPSGTEYSPTFNDGKPYLPEVEIAIQDRMFNVKGELYWPVEPTNPEVHPFWTPEFVGNVMTVNGKSWPYLSVAPRKYRFRMLEGCNARFLNMWLVDAADDQTPGPKITVVGGEGGLLAEPVVIDPAEGGTLLMAPGQRYDVIIDFTGLEGKTFTLKNNAASPYPSGEAVEPGLTDRIMQFRVNGTMVSASGTGTGTDKSSVPDNLRPATPLVQLTDFKGKLSAGVNPVVTRQLLLNEVSADGGPAAVLVNNSYFDASLSIHPDDPYRAGGPTEFSTEGTTEVYKIINTTADAHPIHIHLLQWQMVSRQLIDVDGTGGSGTGGYLEAFGKAWEESEIKEFPEGLGYPGGAGTPLKYEEPNSEGAIGGNPPVGPYLVGPVIPANPEERGWKDNIIVLPGQVTTFVVRCSPTDRAINASPQELLFSFDPSEGPGYVWHCHIVDHEDMSMMRPLPVLPSPERFPKITVHPAPVNACIGDAIKLSVIATSSTTVAYKWQLSTDAGITWKDIVNGTPYAGATTSSLGISPTALPLSGYIYRCILSNAHGTSTSDAAKLTVNSCSIAGTLRYNNIAQDPLSGFTVSVKGLTAVTDASGNFTIKNVTSGNHPVTIKESFRTAGGVNSTDAVSANLWTSHPSPVPNVTYLAGDVNKDQSISGWDAKAIQDRFVLGLPFLRTPWVFWNAAGSGTVNPPAFTVAVNGAPKTELNILGLSTGDFNGSFNPTAPGGNGNVILNASGDILTVPPGKQFDLPLKSVSDLSAGAISLILNIPSNLVKVSGVKVPGSTTPANYFVNGNELRIGWNSIAPVNISANGNLIIISLVPTLAFTDIQTMTVRLATSYLNELADGSANTILNAELNVDDVKVSKSGTPGNVLKVDAYPNPATTTTTVIYQVPVAGIVNLSIYNALGSAVKTLVPNVSQAAGNYSMNVDVSSMKTGLYYIKITLKNGRNTTSKSILFVKK